MGGAGKFEHFAQVIPNIRVDGVATANLLNFIGNELPDVRRRLIDDGFDLANFNTNNKSREETITQLI